MPKLNCIGCQACVDMCPKGAVSFKYDEWGEGKALIDTDKCINCNLCEKICPNISINKNELPKLCYAIKSKQNHCKGSSGGFFYELAVKFIREGGIVYGAVFDQDLRLLHKKATSIIELDAMCKSKYLHSNMKGVYLDIKKDLELNHKVMFVGTPCQVSAVKNLFYKKYSTQLLLVDFLCHGTGTQKIFNYCISYEEKKGKGTIKDFTFRSKSRKAEHSFTYKIEKKNRIYTKSGYAFEFPYYNAFLQYSIFNDACYSCKYSTPERVGDITLGDFWGIEKYSSKFKPYLGTSMIAINSKNGQKYFSKIKNELIIEEYPIHYAIRNNQSYYEAEEYPRIKDTFKKELNEYGADYMIEKNFVRKHLLKSKIYAKTPKKIIEIYNNVRGR